MTNENQMLGTIPRNDKEEVRVQLMSYLGQNRLDFRIFYKDSLSNEFYPTQRGFRIKTGDLDTLMNILKKADGIINAMKENVEAKDANIPPSTIQHEN